MKWSHSISDCIAASRERIGGLVGATVARMDLTTRTSNRHESETCTIVELLTSPKCSQGSATFSPLSKAATESSGAKVGGQPCHWATLVVRQSS